HLQRTNLCNAQAHQCSKLRDAEHYGYYGSCDADPYVRLKACKVESQSKKEKMQTYSTTTKYPF
ncbi:hypothetical protein HAX54_005231, partial [Datura stramonium]|nr:hypothetical protein [Datura stramonium]